MLIGFEPRDGTDPVDLLRVGVWTNLFHPGSSPPLQEIHLVGEVEEENLIEKLQVVDQQQCKR